MFDICLVSIGAQNKSSSIAGVQASEKDNREEQSINVGKNIVLRQTVSCKLDSCTLGFYLAKKDADIRSLFLSYKPVDIFMIYLILC